MNTDETYKIYESYANDFIATHFVGWEFNLAVRFMEITLEGLRQQSKGTTEKTMRDILGRERTL